MVILKEFELSVNIESISFQTKVIFIKDWYEITKTYFKDNGFEILVEKLVNRDLCMQFKVKQLNGCEVYVFNFFTTSGRVVINTKDCKERLLENRIPALEQLFGIIFFVKGETLSNALNLATQTAKNTEKVTNFMKADVPCCSKTLNNINEKQNETREKKQVNDNLTGNKFTNQNVNKNSNELQNSIISQNKIKTVNVNNKSKIPVIQKSSQNNNDYKRASRQTEDFTREIITQQSKTQKEFNNKIEKEQANISEEINQLKLFMYKEIEQAKLKINEQFESKQKEMRKEIYSLQSQINILSKENCDLKEHLEILNINTKPNTQVRKDLITITDLTNETKDKLESYSELQLIKEKSTNHQINNINNTLQEIEKTLQEQARKIINQEQEWGKIKQDINDLSNTIEGTLSNGNPWYTVGKQGKIIPEGDYEEQRNKENIELIVFGDSITKNIFASSIVKCNENEALNYSVGGAKVKGIYDQFRKFKEEHQNASVKNVLVHVGTNHLLLPNNDPDDVARKIGKLLNFLTYELPEAKVFFSAILPKYDAKFFHIIDRVNIAIFFMSLKNPKIHFIKHKKFAINNELNYQFFWKDKLHTSDQGLRQLAKDFIDSIRHNKYLTC